MQQTLKHKDAAMLHEFVRTHVRAGFMNRGQLVSAACDELLKLEYNYDTLYRVVCGCVDELLHAHYGEQRLWKNTDCDRLDEVFSELEQGGIIARHHWSSDQQHGHEEIAELFNLPEYSEHTGYVFYHPGDTLQAVERNYMYIAYGALSGNGADLLAIGSRLVAMLFLAGFKVDWDYDIRSRPCIRKINWQFRRIKELDYETEV